MWKWVQHCKKAYVFSLLFGSLFLSGQSQDISLYGEGDIDRVKLVWIPGSWPQGQSGFVVKRRIAGEDEWESLSGPIIPSAPVNKQLDNVIREPKLREDVIQAFDNYAREGALQYLAENEYRREVLDNPEMLASLALLYTIDYRLLMYSGFGFVDVPPAIEGEYEYGLFRVFADQREELVGSYTWDYGSRPDLNLAVEPAVESTSGRNAYLVKWVFDIIEFREKALKGFDLNIQGEEEQLVPLGKQTRLVLQTNNPAFIAEKVQLDTVEELTVQAVPVSFLGGKGEPIPVEVRRKNALPAIRASVDQVGDSLRMTWRVDGQDIFDYFRIEQENEAGDERILKDGIEGSRWNFIPDSDNQLIRLKVRGFSGTDSMSSNLVIIRYRTITQPERPAFNATYTEEGARRYIRMQWDNELKEDGEIVKLYIAYNNDDELAWDASVRITSGSSYDYPVLTRQGAVYRMAISYRNTDYEESEQSEEVRIEIPSLYIPPVNRFNVTTAAETLVIDWDYDYELVDLAGFRVYLNDEVATAEGELSVNSRSWNSGTLSPGRYEVSISAVTLSGRQSDRKVIKRISIE